MDLKDGRITVNQVLRNPQAMALLQKELPELAGSPLLRMAGGMSLNQVLSFVKGKVPPEKIRGILDQLKAI